jgi:hypothetical protein
MKDSVGYYLIFFIGGVLLGTLFSYTPAEDLPSVKVESQSFLVSPNSSICPINIPDPVIIVERIQVDSNSSKWYGKGNCPFGNVDLFLVIDEKNLPLGRFLFTSIETFFPCYGILHIFTDPPVFKKLSGWGYLQRAVFHQFSLPSFFEDKVPGYIAQAWAMMWADVLINSTADYVMFLDSDSIFGMPVTCASIFDENGLPWMGYWSFSGQLQFQGQCEHFIGDCLGSFMSFLPLTVPLNAFPAMRNHISKRTGHSGFDESFLAWVKQPESPVMTFSQFVLMGNFMAIFLPGKVHSFSCPHISEVNSSTKCLSYIPPAGHLWASCKYVGNCGSGVLFGNWGAPLGDKYTSKFTYDSISQFESTIFMGYCNMHRMYNGTTSSTLAAFCTPEQSTNIHPWLLPYGDHAPTVQRIDQVFGPNGFNRQGREFCGARP